MKAKFTVSTGIIPPESSAFEELTKNVMIALTSFAESDTNCLTIEINRTVSPFKDKTDVWVHGFDYAMPIRQRGRIRMNSVYKNQLEVDISNDEQPFPTSVGSYRTLRLEPIEPGSDVFRVWTHGGGFGSLNKIPRATDDTVRLVVIENGQEFTNTQSATDPL